MKLKLAVLPEDLRAGIPKDSTFCALALTLRRHMRRRFPGTDWAPEIGLTRGRAWRLPFIDDDVLFEFSMPLELQDYVQAIDHQEDVKPQSFVVDIKRKG